MYVEMTRIPSGRVVCGGLPDDQWPCVQVQQVASPPLRRSHARRPQLKSHAESCHATAAVPAVYLRSMHAGRCLFAAVPQLHRRSYCLLLAPGALCAATVAAKRGGCGGAHGVFGAVGRGHGRVWWPAGRGSASVRHCALLWPRTRGGRSIPPFCRFFPLLFSSGGGRRHGEPSSGAIRKVRCWHGQAKLAQERSGCTCAVARQVQGVGAWVNPAVKFPSACHWKRSRCPHFLSLSHQ
uniref:Uncharacterized protein n=1 Tax=Setaria viridis TaxID=4556 RepID=A0A4U6UNJ7_SETVI|nr:hypothetical protein SEVIR_5G266750v2 [Setaria viridis]